MLPKAVLLYPDTYILLQSIFLVEIIGKFEVHVSLDFVFVSMVIFELQIRLCKGSRC